MVLAINSSLEVKDMIFERISNIESVSGQMEFSILLTCVKNPSEKTLNIARKRVSKCLEAELYLLAKKYIDSFDLKMEYPFSVVEKYLLKCGRDGKIGAMAAWAQLYPKEEIKPYLKTAIEVQLQKDNLHAIVQHSDTFFDSLDDYAEIIQESMLSSSYDSYKRKVKFIRKISKLIKSKDILNNMGVIIACNPSKQWGFVAHCVRPENYFFHFSAIEQKSITPIIGQFVTFKLNEIVETSKRHAKIKRLKVVG